MTAKLLTVFVLIRSVFCEDQPLVKTPLGQVRGYHKTSYDGRIFSAFEGIPFAKPPIGELRFEEPQPIDPWLGVWNASLSTECAQTLIKGMEVLSPEQPSEDCLYLNVYVPRDTPDQSEDLDVIVHIHASAFMYGRGNLYAHPDSLMDHDVIFVTLNYRLGILGFLSTEDDVVPGNNGLKDQTMALSWIRDNIKSFGGNPNSVTINGYSAGGSSVHFHYLSPLSKGLYHRGFAQSGVALSPWSIQEKPLVKTKKLAAAVGCPTHDTKLLVKCLKQRPYQYLLDQISLFFTHSFMPITPFGPVVEKGGSKPFLNQHPYILLKNGKVHDLPMIASIATQEGTTPVMLLINELDEIGQKWEFLAPSFLEFNDTLPPSSWTSTTKKITDFYLGDDEFNQKNVIKVIQMFSDRYYAVGAETSVRMQAKVNKSPVYYYVFNYPGDNNPQKIVGHMFDSKFYYASVLVFEALTPDEVKMKDLLVNMMVSFAKTGTPVLGNVEWRPTKDDELTYLRIDGIRPGEIRLERVAELTPVGFWNSLNLNEGKNLISRKDEL